MNEKEFQKIVIDLAHMYGWKVAHFRTSQIKTGVYATAVDADGAGFPDLVMVRGERLIFAELKVGKNKLSQKQIEWCDALLTAGARWCLWHERDLNLIKEIIK